MGIHIGRSWDGPGDIEATCPCPKAPCGLVDRDNLNEDCEQHPPTRHKTIRTRHSADECPGVGRDVGVAVVRTYAARQAIVDAAAMGEPAGWVNASLFDAVDEYRAAVEYEAAKRILELRATVTALAARQPFKNGYDAALMVAALTIDPEVSK
ncbi:hypothetical protein [Streptomyces sp. NPDC057557]|uniref:hypothetical protein n=1 Tax=Streptomyces sp. NPDC057557 TaxID=3346167 RepID=UPI00368413D5